MVAGADVIHQSMPVLDVQYRCIAKEVAAAPPVSPPSAVLHHVRAAAESVAVEIAVVGSEMEFRSSDAASALNVEPAGVPFVPSIRSGSYADIGPRKYMEDEHIRIDDLAAHLGSMFRCPTPSAFYGVFDGHGGPDAAAYVRKNALRLFFEEADFPQSSQADDDAFLQEVVNSVRKTFLRADDALADHCTVNSSGTTALTALVLGCRLLVANAGDCRAVLCRKGVAVDMSQDHRPVRESEHARVVECGGFVDDVGYLNGVLSVSRALGDWDLKLPRGAPSPLIAEPEFMQAVLTEDDEFLVIGCDGIWDVMSSQAAVGVVRRGLRRHDDPGRCARELVMEALRLNTFDNLTVIVVCFSSPEHHREPSPRPRPQPRLRCCSLSAEALCSLRSWLNDDGAS